MRANKLWPLGAAILLAGGAAQAADPESCQTVRFSDVGWTDITSTTAATADGARRASATSPRSRSCRCP